MSAPEYTLLSAIADNGGAVYAREIDADALQAVRLLSVRGYVLRQGALDLAVYALTDAGRLALVDQVALRKRLRLESLRYWITTAIAFAALIVSIIALIAR